MNVTVRLFAGVRQAAGAPSISLELPPQATIADLRAHLAAALPAAAHLVARALIAVDSEYADDRRPLSPQAEIACIPPVSGG